jgi:signal transduction histidine kinase
MATSAELFGPFEQRGADRSGMGLGLAFSRWGAEANGGRIYARNLPGKNAFLTSTCRACQFLPSKWFSLEAAISTLLREGLRDLRTLGVRVNLNLAKSHSAMNSAQERRLAPQRVAPCDEQIKNRTDAQTTRGS